MEEHITVESGLGQCGDYRPATIHLLAVNNNSIDFIDGFLKSLDDQTLTRFDVTIVNRKSTDGSWEKIDSWRPRGGIVLRKKAGGCVGPYEDDNMFSYINMAALMSLSKNEKAYICPINISDRLTTAALKIMRFYAADFEDVDVFYPNFKIVDDKEYNNIIGYQNWPEYSYENLLKENLCECAPLIRGKTFIEAASYDTEFKYAANYDLFLRLSSAGAKFKLIEEVIGSHYEVLQSPEILAESNEEIDYVRQLHMPISYDETL